MTGDLASWREGPAKKAIIDFVARTCGEGESPPVPPEERVAVFDNDGTLWCEKPMPIQLDFTVRRLAEMARENPSLQDQQPYQAAYQHDLKWMGAAMVKHYHGDDSDLQLLMGAAMDFFDDGPEKPIRIWSRIGRRPILASGNSNGDVPMLAFAGTPATPSLRLLLLHDDAEREFDYVAGAEQALEVAGQQNWTVVSIKDDWNIVFADAT